MKNINFNNTFFILILLTTILLNLNLECEASKRFRSDSISFDDLQKKSKLNSTQDEFTPRREWGFRRPANPIVKIYPTYETWELASGAISTQIHTFRGVQVKLAEKQFAEQIDIELKFPPNCAQKHPCGQSPQLFIAGVGNLYDELSRQRAFRSSDVENFLRPSAGRNDLKTRRFVSQQINGMGKNNQLDLPIRALRLRHKLDLLNKLHSRFFRAVGELDHDINLGPYFYKVSEEQTTLYSYKLIFDFWKSTYKLAQESLDLFRDIERDLFISLPHKTHRLRKTKPPIQPQNIHIDRWRTQQYVENGYTFPCSLAELYINMTTRIIDEANELIFSYYYEWGVSYGDIEHLRQPSDKRTSRLPSITALSMSGICQSYINDFNNQLPTHRYLEETQLTSSLLKQMNPLFVELVHTCEYIEHMYNIPTKEIILNDESIASFEEYIRYTLKRRREFDKLIKQKVEDDESQNALEDVKIFKTFQQTTYPRVQLILDYARRNNLTMSENDLWKKEMSPLITVFLQFMLLHEEFSKICSTF